MCDYGDTCGSHRICAKEDPKKAPGGCPISSRRLKKNIRYLSSEALHQLADQVEHIRLARYSYASDPTHTPRLGFIIEDMPQSFAVGAEQTMVDLYGYTSMAVATLQVQRAALAKQQREIDELRQEIARLRGEGKNIRQPPQRPKAGF
jgi:hypothetical protein